MHQQTESGTWSLLIRTRAGLGAILVLAMGNVSATVLTFDGTAFGNVTQIPDAYGDRVTDFGLAGDNLIYGAAGGVTPNVVVDYLSEAAPFFNRPGGYGDLGNALHHQHRHGEVVLTPDAGFRVTLHGFDIGAWFEQSPYPDSRVRVLDSAGTVHFDSGLFTAEFDPNDAGVPGHYSYPLTPITSSLALRIEAPYGDLGLDNVHFSQSVVPLPAAVWLLGAAVGGLGFMRRRNV